MSAKKAPLPEEALPEGSPAPEPQQPPEPTLQELESAHSRTTRQLRQIEHQRQQVLQYQAQLEAMIAERERG